MSATYNFPESLLDAYLDGSISATDRKVLMDWFEGFSDAEVKVLLDRSAGKTPDKALIKEGVWQKIEARTGINLQPETKMGKRRHLSFYKYGVVAAVCLVLIALSYWSVQYLRSIDRKKAETLMAKATTVDNLMVDHQGALLTLSSGQVVKLDSAVTGQIATQGGAKILQKDGQVRYQNALADQQGSKLLNTMTTPRGKQFSLILPDGTKVWLNAASSITYPVQFAPDRRKVQVTGEVYFEVAHLTASDHITRIPFDVMSGGMQIEVLGTHFDIQNYPDNAEIKTTLLEGSVRVSYGNKGLQKKMVPGQLAILNRAKPDNIALQEVDVQRAVAWKDGLFSFKDEPLSDILKEVSRWYAVSAEAAPSKRGLRFSGVVSKRAKLADLLNVLSATGVVQFKISDNKVYGY